MPRSSPARARHGRLRPLAAVAVLLAAGTTACTTAVEGRGSAGTSVASAPGSSSAGGATASPTGSASSAPALANACGAFAAPDPDRPKVDLRFDLAGDHRTVKGTERVVFTPDARITELVFRLTANTAESVDEGNRIQVTSVSTPDGGTPRFDRAGASADTQGGLLRIPLTRAVAAGSTVETTIGFTLALGEGAFDRFGRSVDDAWWGSGHPLLAWERGYGWHTEPMIGFTAESATSEAMDTTLTVTAPADDVVVMSGNPREPSGESGGRRTWTASLTTARDVAVAAGPFAVVDRTVSLAGGQQVALRVGGRDRDNADALAGEFERALTELSQRFGSYPFPSLAVARLPVGGGGIEYPGAILMLDDSTRVAVHEAAHQWFYAMVGNSQAEHAWLDEAFASWAEQSIDGGAPSPARLDDPDPVDKPTADWGDDAAGYYRTTYDKGSAALFAARSAAGAGTFDRAVDCYVARNAWKVADPADLQAALTDLPAAVSVLEDAGALR